MNARTLIFSFFTFTSFALASAKTLPSYVVPVLADPGFLRSAGLPIWREDLELNVAYSLLNEYQLERLSVMAHAQHRCGGFEVIQEIMPSQSKALDEIFATMRERKRRDEEFSLFGGEVPEERDERVAAAVTQVRAEGVKKWVEWFSSFHNRFNRGDRANDAITALKTSLDELAARVDFPVSVDLIDHDSTPQKSLRFSITGSLYPKEVIVMGGHADSVNWQNSGAPAPGADDNASGSSNLLEALRVLLAQGQPERSLHVFWYAGEESGLLGSAEIAQTYKSENVDVIAALQLDMTLFPGSGVKTIASIRDFTSPWLHGYLLKLNQYYLNLRILDDQCGYACSDHASWHRRGFHTVFPFEAKASSMNRRIHTAQDVIDEGSDFEHSAEFSKIAVAFAMHLANSRHRGP